MGRGQKPFLGPMDEFEGEELDLPDDFGPTFWMQNWLTFGVGMAAVACHLLLLLFTDTGCDSKEARRALLKSLKAML